MSDRSYLAPEFLDFEHTAHASVFDADEPIWSALSKIEGHLADLLDNVEGDRILGNVDERAVIGDDVFIAKGATVEAFATVKGPAWIGAGTTVRSGAYVRGNVIVGKNCMLGNSSEFKNCLLFDNCEVPHFNYVGDSILGYKAHIGAGVICSNVRLDRQNVKIEGQAVDGVEGIHQLRWFAFAAAGLPDSPGRESWPEYDPGSPQQMVFGRPMSGVENVPPSPGIDLMRERIEWLTETLAGPLEPVAPDSADDGEPVEV